VLNGTLEDVVHAYRVLAVRRINNGFSASPIPLSEIKAYIDLFGMPIVGLQMFVDLITIMDQEYLSLQNATS
jgi:hypothetical protein